MLMEGSGATCRRVAVQASQQNVVSKGIGFLGNYVKALEEMQLPEGRYIARVIHTNAETQKRQLVAKAEKEHNDGEKQRVDTEREEARKSGHASSSQPIEAKKFNTSDYPALLQRLAYLETHKESIFLAGWYIVFPWAKHFLDKSDIAILGTDAGHCTSELGGMLFAIDLIDNNRQVVPIFRAFWSQTEHDFSWKSVFGWAVEHLPELNRKESFIVEGEDGYKVYPITIFRDGHPSISKGLKDKWPNAKRFSCSWHAGQGVTKKVHLPNMRYGEQTAAELYQQLVYAMREPQYHRLRNALPLSLDQHLRVPQNAHIDDKERFLALFLKDGGKTQATLNTMNASNPQYVVPRTATGFSEAMMWSAFSNQVRDSPPLNMLIQLVEKSAVKMIDQAYAARDCQKSAPPKVMRMLEVASEQARVRLNHRPAQARVDFQDRERKQAKVYAAVLKAPHGYRVVNLASLSSPKCDCGFPEVTGGYPCEHIILAAMEKGIVDLTMMLPRRETTRAWRELYDWFKAGSFSLYPSTDDVLEGTPLFPNMCLPISVPKPAARPKKRRHLSALEKSGIGKKQRACRKCGLLGHYAKGCPAGSRTVLH